MHENWLSFQVNCMNMVVMFSSYARCSGFLRSDSTFRGNHERIGRDARRTGLLPDQKCAGKSQVLVHWPIDAWRAPAAAAPQKHVSPWCARRSQKYNKDCWTLVRFQKTKWSARKSDATSTVQERKSDAIWQSLLLAKQPAIGIHTRWHATANIQQWLLDFSSMQRTQKHADSIRIQNLTLLSFRSGLNTETASDSTRAMNTRLLGLAQWRKGTIM